MQLDYSNYRCEAKKHVGSNLCQEDGKPLSKEEGHKFGALAGTEEKVAVVVQYSYHYLQFVHCHTSSLMPHMYAHTQLPQLTREREIDPITRKYPPNLPSPFPSQLQSQSEILTSELDLQQARETSMTLSPDAKQSSPPHSSQPQPLKSSVEAEVGPSSSSKPTPPPQSEPNTFSPISNTAPKLTNSQSSDADNSLGAASLEYKDNAADTEGTVSDYNYEDDVFEHDEEGEMDAGDGDGEQQYKATEAVERLTPCVPTNSTDCINVETQTNSDNINASVVAPTEADQHEEMHKYDSTPEHKGNSSTEVSTPGEDLPEDNSYSMDKPSPEQPPKTYLRDTGLWFPIGKWCGRRRKGLVRGGGEIGEVKFVRGEVERGRKRKSAWRRNSAWERVERGGELEEGEKAQKGRGEEIHYKKSLV